MPPSAGLRDCPMGLGTFRGTLLLTCALFVLWAPAAVAQVQIDFSALGQDMEAMEAMSPEDRLDSMEAVAMRGGTCGMDMNGNHSLDTPDVCTSQQFGLWRDHIESCICKPRETVISLHAADTTNVLLPNMMVVSRCSGQCYTMGHNCMATRTAPKAVTLFHKDPSRLRCGAARVMEDTECGCSCPMSATDCSDRQEFRADLCMCRCKKTPEFRRGCREGHRWDPSQCRCVCETQRECSTGSGWSNDYCRCLRMIMPTAGEDNPNADSDNSVRY